jgi:hypothetical protein
VVQPEAVLGLAAVTVMVPKPFNPLSTGRFVRSGKRRAKALLSCAGFRFAPPSWRNRRFPWEELVMADINATVSNFLEKISQILEKPYNAMALGAGLTFLLLLLYHVTSLGDGYFGAFFTFLHVVSGITWIGLLYYFNLVQIPTMPKIPAEMKPAIGQYIAPEALFWFRWSALATVVTGLIVFSTSSAASSWPSMFGSSSGRTRRKCSASFPPTTKPRRRPRGSRC